MLQKLEIQGVGTDVDDKLRRYITKKIGGIDKYVGRRSQASAHAEVFIKKTVLKQDHHCTSEVTLYLPHETINITESAPNIFASIDIVESKLKQRIQKYKDLHGSAKQQRHLFSRLKIRSLPID
jgi:ribosomal subunit interface protein